MANLLGRLPVAEALLLDPVTEEFNRALLERLVEVPKDLIRNIDDPAPEIGFIHMILPIGSEIFRIEFVELARRPALDMNSVGDAGDRDLSDRNILPYSLPEPLAHLAVQLTDTIGEAAGSQGENGHAEDRFGINGHLTELHEL